MRNDVLIHYGVKGMLWRKGKKGSQLPSGNQRLHTAADPESRFGRAFKPIKKPAIKSKEEKEAEKKAEEAYKRRQAKKEEVKKIADKYKEKVKQREQSQVNTHTQSGTGGNSKSIKLTNRQRSEYSRMIAPKAITSPKLSNVSTANRNVNSLRRNAVNSNLDKLPVAKGYVYHKPVTKTIKKTVEKTTKSKGSSSGSSGGGSQDRHNTVGSFKTKSSGGSSDSTPKERLWVTTETTKKKRR